MDKVFTHLDELKAQYKSILAEIKNEERVLISNYAKYQIRNQYKCSAKINGANYTSLIVNDITIKEDGGKTSFYYSCTFYPDVHYHPNGYRFSEEQLNDMIING